MFRFQWSVLPPIFRVYTCRSGQNLQFPSGYSFLSCSIKTKELVLIAAYNIYEQREFRRESPRNLLSAPLQIYPPQAPRKFLQNSHRVYRRDLPHRCPMTATQVRVNMHGVVGMTHIVVGLGWWDGNIDNKTTLTLTQRH